MRLKFDCGKLTFMQLSLRSFTKNITLYYTRLVMEPNQPFLESLNPK